jgi:GABA permease
MAFISSMRDELLLTGFITAIVLGSYFIFKSRKEKANTSGNHAAQQPDPEILP